MQILKSFFSFLTVTLLSTTIYAQTNSKLYLLVSGYTKPVNDKGISVYEFDTNDGTLKLKSLIGDIENPSYLAVSNNGKYVYAVSEAGKPNGKVFSYKFDIATASLSKLNEVSAGGRGPCYISIDKKDQHVFIANYSDGNIASIGIDKNGMLDSLRIQSIKHTGSSIDKDNQKGPHGHSIVLSPDQKFALSTDLGSDRIYIYKYDAKNKFSLIPSVPEYITVKAGSGPRHVTFHASGKYVYVVNELNGSVDGFSYKNGELIQQQTITMLPEGFHGVIEAADIHISPDGKFLYASNREELNEISIYSIDKNGMLTAVARQSVLGNAPRNFVIDPTGKYLLCANMNSNEIVIFQRDKNTGLLQPLAERVTTTAPACLKFFPVK